MKTIDEKEEVERFLIAAITCASEETLGRSYISVAASADCGIVLSFGDQEFCITISKRDQNK